MAKSSSAASGAGSGSFFLGSGFFSSFFFSSFFSALAGAAGPAPTDTLESPLLMTLIER